MTRLHPVFLFNMIHVCKYIQFQVNMQEPEIAIQSDVTFFLSHLYLFIALCCNHECTSNKNINIESPFIEI